MNKLLRAGLAALRKNKCFYAALAGVVGLAVWIGVVHVYEYALFDGLYRHDLYDGFTSGLLLLYFLIPALSAWIIGNEHGEGTLRNKIIAGHSRVSIYFSELITVLIASLLLFAAYAAVLLAFDLPTSGGLRAYFPTDTPQIFALIFLMILAMSALYVMIAMLCQNRIASVLTVMFLAIITLAVASLAFTKLLEPEFFTVVTEIAEDGTALATGLEPNPTYPRGAARGFYQFLLDALPAGQLFTLANGDTARFGLQLLYSLLLALVSTVAGIFVFRRKDLK